eukprot:COSAG05_NODE_20799_length_276_cov_2.045198_1_plen_84_part_01
MAAALWKATCPPFSLQILSPNCLNIAGSDLELDGVERIGGPQQCNSFGLFNSRCGAPRTNDAVDPRSLRSFHELIQLEHQIPLA